MIESFKNILKSVLGMVLPDDNYARLLHSWRGWSDSATDITFDQVLAQNSPRRIRLKFAVEFPDGKPADEASRYYVSKYLWSDENNRLGHEPELTNLLGLFLRDDLVFYDVGANAGFCSAYAARVPGYRGQVHAFEPLPEMAKMINEFKESHRGDASVTVHQVALGEKPGRMTIHWDTDYGLASLALDRGENSEEVEVETIDTIGADSPGFLKVDAEGYEYNVFKGAETLLKTAPPLIFFESTCEDRGSTESLLPFDYLAGFGYEFFLPAWEQPNGTFHVGIGPDFSFEMPVLIPFDIRERLTFPGEAINVVAAPRGFDWTPGLKV